MPAQIFCLSLLPPPHTASCRIVFARPNSLEMSPLELQPASLHCGQEAITGSQGLIVCLILFSILYCFEPVTYAAVEENCTDHLVINVLQLMLFFTL